MTPYCTSATSRDQPNIGAIRRLIRIFPVFQIDPPSIIADHTSIILQSNTGYVSVLGTRYLVPTVLYLGLDRYKSQQFTSLFFIDLKCCASNFQKGVAED